MKRTVTIRPRVYPSSKRTVWEVDAGVVDQVRLRRARSTREEAEALAQQFSRLDKQDVELRILEYSASRQAELAGAIDLAEHNRFSLLEAAEFYVAHRGARPPDPKEIPTVHRAIQDYLVSLDDLGRREETLHELEVRLGRLDNQEFGRKLVSQITGAALAAFAQKQARDKRTRYNLLTKLSQFFGWCQSQGWLLVNPLDNVVRPIPDEKTPRLFSVADCRRLLKAAAECQLLPYVTLSLFAGLGQAEILRLNWRAIHIEAREVVIDPDTATNRKQRINPISDNLAAWLASFRDSMNEPGPVSDRHRFWNRFRKWKDAVQKGSKGAWPFNGLQNSFVSYHYARLRKAGSEEDQAAKLTADMIGLEDPGLLQRHFRQPVKPAAADEFWNLVPS
jgi:integrase